MFFEGQKTVLVKKCQIGLKCQEFIEVFSCFLKGEKHKTGQKLHKTISKHTGYQKYRPLVKWCQLYLYLSVELVEIKNQPP